MLYFDPSALVKLYVDEPMSQELAVAVDEADAIATSLLAYAEARLSAHAYRQCVEAFAEDWTRYIIVEVTDRLVKKSWGIGCPSCITGIRCGTFSLGLNSS